MVSNADNISDLTGTSAGGGAAYKGGLVVGADVTTASKNGRRITTVTGSLGLGGVATPYVVPVEVHGGATYSQPIWSFNVTQPLMRALNATRGATQSVYASIQNQLNGIAAQIKALQSLIYQISNKTNSK